LRSLLDLTSKRTILVTNALPYANNSLHLGHVLEHVQTDVWVRFQRLRGETCWYVCASDAHGTPTMLRAEQEGIAPADLIMRVSAEHRRDFATFRISVDNYITTHDPENEELTSEIYRRLAARGFIARKIVKQAYDEERQMFLPDRYVRGTNTATRARTAARPTRRSTSRTPSPRCRARSRRHASPSTCS
jgi:methionyl-tRNA synthetase